VQRVTQVAAVGHEEAGLVGLRDEAQRALAALDETFVALGRPLADPESRGYEDQRRITEALRASDEWLAVELAAERLRDALGGVLRAGELVKGAADDASGEDARVELEGALAELHGVEAAFGRIIHSLSSPDICWISVDAGGAIALHSAPAHSGAHIDRAVTRGRHAAVFTSATLAVAGSFSFVLDRFGLGDRAATHRVGSGFDYRHQALLVLPTGLVDPYDTAFVGQTAAVVADVATRLGGRTLVLFTSHSMLRAVQSRVAQRLESGRIAVLAQSAGASRRQLLEQFVAGEAVLLGTATFWEGIDLPGELLRCVVVAKLPFPVPDDPVIAGRSERYEDPFQEYHVPIAALRLRQGFGRLIRTREDRGAVVLLDRRLSVRAYGDTLLRSLPECTIARPGPDDVATVVAEWCEEKQTAGS
jgi:DNA polymerase-3 subunit epsilon/ATP-dependent DNA helicase DinG